MTGLTENLRRHTFAIQRMILAVLCLASFTTNVFTTLENSELQLPAVGYNDSSILFTI